MKRTPHVLLINLIFANFKQRMKCLVFHSVRSYMAYFLLIRFKGFSHPSSRRIATVFFDGDLPSNIAWDVCKSVDVVWYNHQDVFLKMHHSSLPRTERVFLSSSEFLLLFFLLLNTFYAPMGEGQGGNVEERYKKSHVHQHRDERVRSDTIFHFKCLRSTSIHHHSRAELESATRKLPARVRLVFFTQNYTSLSSIDTALCLNLTHFVFWCNTF